MVWFGVRGYRLSLSCTVSFEESYAVVEYCCQF
jgi:hypothetical protein